MSKKRALLNMVLLSRYIVSSPRRVFHGRNQYEFSQAIVIFFLIGASITLFKTFIVRRNIPTLTFFNDSVINSVFSWFNIPQVRWGWSYVIYFTFILLVVLMCSLLNNKRVAARSLLLSIMSINVIGVVIQMLSYILGVIASHGVAVVYGYLAYAWVVVLSVWAIMESQQVSVLKAIICFLIPATLALVLVGFPGIAPYLAWLYM